MTDTNTDPNYQDILNKYSQDLANNPDPEIPENPPEPETATLTEVESTPVVEPIDTLSNPPEDTLANPPEDSLAKVSEPTIDPPPVVPPTDLPPTSPEPQPTPTSANPVIDTEIPSAEMSPPPEEPKTNNFFKFLFFFALIAFIIVLVLVFRSLLNSQSSTSNPIEDTFPSTVPTVSQQADNYCVFNDQRFTIGQQFDANDGCNTCVCGEDLKINCTTLTCPATQSSLQISPTSTATASPTL